MTPTPETCPKCNTKLDGHGSSIGLYCPNKACDIGDGPFDGSPKPAFAPRPASAPTPADEVLAREIGDTCLTLTIPEGSKGPHSFTEFNDAKAAQLIAAHVAAQAPSGLIETWQPIATALKHGIILVANENGTWPAKWDTHRSGFYECGHEYENSINATHWRPLPCLAAHKAQPVADVRGMVEAVKEYDVQMAAIGGCCDGYCYVLGKAKGMHTNGGCHCLREGRHKGVRVAGAARKLRDTVAALTSARHAMGGEVK